MIYDIKYEIARVCKLPELFVLHDVSREFKEIVDILLKCYVCDKFDKSIKKCYHCEKYICQECEQGDDLCKECMGDCDSCNKERKTMICCVDCDINICVDCCGFICDCGPRCYDCGDGLGYSYCEDCNECTCHECEETIRYSFYCESCGALLCNECCDKCDCGECWLCSDCCQL
jgi:hypothetical protein